MTVGGGGPVNLVSLALATVTDPSYRVADEADASWISALVRRALPPDRLPGWTTKAVSSLIAKARPERLSGEIRDAAFAHVAVQGTSVIGFILCKNLRFLNLVVVEPTLERRGIGSRLIECMLDHITAAAPHISVVEVNATEHSLPFYRRLGFYPLSQFVEFDGCRFARMGFWRKNPTLLKSEC
jgi:predicted N-acetyltransferase YhbS